MSSDIPLLNSCLKDSDVQKLRNTVSSFNNESESSDEIKNLESSNLNELNIINNQPLRKIGLTGKFYCGGKLC